jgi:hypothetical protein
VSSSESALLLGRPVIYTRPFSNRCVLLGRAVPNYTPCSPLSRQNEPFCRDFRHCRCWNRAKLTSMKALIVVICFFVCATASKGGDMFSPATGSTLLTKCHAAEKMDEVSPQLTSEEREAAAFCLGYIQGSVTVDRDWQAGEDHYHTPSSKQVWPHFCVPDSATYPQIVRITVKWLESNPKFLNEAGWRDVHRALMEAYPCP